VYHNWSNKFFTFHNRSDQKSALFRDQQPKFQDFYRPEIFSFIFSGLSRTPGNPRLTMLLLDANTNLNATTTATASIVSTYKLCLTTWKTLHTSQPLYLSELISHYLPHRSLRSSNTNLLTRPDGITSNFSSRAFCVSAPSTWNSLPAHTRSIDTLSTYKRHLKFHLFQSAFTV